MDHHASHCARSEGAKKQLRKRGEIARMIEHLLFDWHKLFLGGTIEPYHLPLCKIRGYEKPAKGGEIACVSMNFCESKRLTLGKIASNEAHSIDIPAFIATCREHQQDSKEKQRC